jgi:hypothetical protein
MSSLTRLRVRILVPPHTARTEDRVQKLREQEIQRSTFETLKTFASRAYNHDSESSSLTVELKDDNSKEEDTYEFMGLVTCSNSES